MATIAERILRTLAQDGPLDDDELAARLEIRRQSVFPVATRLGDEGHIARYKAGPRRKWTNSLLDDPRTVPTADPAPTVEETGLVSEDEVKAAVCDHLEAAGYTVTVAWGRVRGIDIEADHASRARQVIEAKGEVNSDQQQGSYFLQGLGELIQRMDDPAAVYALALPDNRRYRGLVTRLPAFARQRLGLRVYWVTRCSTGFSVEVADG